MSDELPAFLGITPFGVYCTKCNLSLSIVKGIEKHGKDFHSGDKFKTVLVVREVHRQMKVLRELHANDLTPFLTENPSLHPTWFCTVCFSAFNKSCNYHRHFMTRDSTCYGGIGGKIACFISICGRLGPKSCNLGTTSPVSTLTIFSKSTIVSTLTDDPSQASKNPSLTVEPSSKVPATLLATVDEACAILSPFVRADEDARELTMIFYPLLAPGFEGKIKDFLSYSTNQPDEDGILFKWLEAGREWLGKYAAGHIANVSANVRSRLAEFEQKELDGVVVGSRTFSLRRGISRLMTELDSILRFFYHYPTTLFDAFKSKEVKNSTKNWMIEAAIIPKILFTAAVEEPEDHGKLPVTCLYCLSRGFSMKGGSNLTMNECGWFASRISAVLHLLRAGVCGYLITLSREGSNSKLTGKEMDIVGEIQNGRVTNLISPYIKRLRDLNARKPPVKSNTINSNGDITSGGFTFPHSVWSTIIPRVFAIAKACFMEIFNSSQWQLFLDKPINMTDWVRLDVFVLNDGSRVCLRDLGIKPNLEPVLAKVQSVMELCFFGLGVGAVRHEEVIRLTVLSCQWHNSYLYFWSESVKRGSLKAKTTPKLSEHRLSLSLSRVILLARYVLVASTDLDQDKLFPSYPDASMLGLLQDIFDFDCQPQMLNARHFFTSMGNIIMPESGATSSGGCFVSTLKMTEKSGHTQVTGRRAYGTWLENSDEVLYDCYHQNLGEETMEPPLVDFTPFSGSILKAALKELLGRKANYRSEEQKKMIEIAANSVSRHAFVGLPCGQGKSLSWLVPTMAAYLSGRHVGLRIVIVPFKFLLGHIVQHAVSALGLLQEKLQVHFLISSEINQDSFPSILDGKELPSLLFLNLDGAATLIRFHLSRLQDLAKRDVLKRVYIDEFQQLVVEYGFRSSYQSFQEVARIGVPVMCLSGSLPVSIAMSLMSYCRLKEDEDNASLDVVRPSDPIGNGFSLDVLVVADVTKTIIEFVLTSRVGACHVICSSISLVQMISSGLSKHLKVLSITGDSSYQEQIRCARAWYKGEHDVLVSTVVGLVGNENYFCKTIVVGGFLYNVSSVVQAIGRLRPNQRGPKSTIRIICYPIRAIDRIDADESSKTLFEEMVAAGCVSIDRKDVFMKIFAPVGLHGLLSLQHGCYLQEMSGYYGFARLPCNRCGLCLKAGVPSPLSLSLTGSVDSRQKESDIIGMSDTQVESRVFVNPYKKRDMDTSVANQDHSKKSRQTYTDSVLVSSQFRSDDISQVSKILRRKAKWVFCELLYRCLNCGTATCNGELCLKACYRCGERNHNTNGCVFNKVKLGKILENKGVCFGCFDTRQHVMVKHDVLNCPLKRRFKRLVFLDRERKRVGFEVYLRKLYSSEFSFVSMVASYSNETKLGRVWIGTRKETNVLRCIQMDHCAPGSPLLPPDVIDMSSDNSCDGTPRTTRFKDVTRARLEYNRLRLEKLSIRRQRKFVFGAMYESVFQGYYVVDPLECGHDLVVTLHTQKESVVQVRLVSPDDGIDKKNLLSSMVDLGRSLSGPGNCRGYRVGDNGSMHAMGLKSASSKELYKITENTSIKASAASTVMREWMEDNMRDTLRLILSVDSNLQVRYPPFMPRGPGSRMMVSVNLANSPHYDTGDSSESIGVWVEEKPGQSDNWYFVLPNVSYMGSKGVLVKLVHGVVISWDGREIYHCTSKTIQGEGNKTYGCMWSSSRE